MNERKAVEFEETVLPELARKGKDNTEKHTKRSWNVEEITRKILVCKEIYLA